MKKRISAESVVTSTSKRRAGLTGRVLEVITTGTRPKFKIQWSDSQVETMFGNTLVLPGAETVRRAVNRTGSAEDNDENPMASVSDTDDSSEEEEGEEDGNVTADLKGLIDEADTGAPEAGVAAAAVPVDPEPAAVPLPESVAAVVHDQVWGADGEITDDCRRTHERSYFIWETGVREREKLPLDYFFLMFPPSILDTCIRETNTVMARENRGAPIDIHDLWQYLGIRLAMSLEGRKCPLKDFWDDSVGYSDSLFSPISYKEKFGMTYQRFAAISSSLRFADFDEDTLDDDPWCPIRPLVEAFNQRRIEVVHPGEHVVVDECMSAWRGLDTYEVEFVLPHKTKIPRKPQGVGCELKSCTDCESGVLLRLELVEGKHAMATTEYANVYAAQVALISRLTAPLHGTERTVHAGSSAFSSVACAHTMRQHGLHFLGCVKTATKCFPKAKLSELLLSDDKERGSHAVLSTKVISTEGRESTIFAVGWKDKKIKHFVCTRGTTLPGKPSDRRLHRVVHDGESRRKESFIKSIKRPSVVAMYFDEFPTIDVHDHYRQASLATDRSWSAKTWWHGLFASIFGMICSDAYLACRHELRPLDPLEPSNVPSFQCFLDRLAFALTHTRRESTPMPMVLRGHDEILALHAQHHALTPFIKLPFYAKNKGTNCRSRRSCHVCKQKTAFYCLSCSVVKEEKRDCKFVPLCNPSKSGRGSGGALPCYLVHTQHPNP